MAEGKSAAPSAEPEPSRRLFRHRTGRSRRKHAPADRRRAHQRDRLARFQESGRRRKMGRSHRNRPPPGEKRRAHRRCLPAEHRSRRDEGHSAVLREADPQDQSAGHDRHHRRALPSSWRSPIARARASSIRSTSKTAKRSSNASARSRAPTARRWSSAASTKIPVQAQAFTRERKLAVAERSVQLADRKSTAFAPEDIIFDPLVFPCATGDENYIGGAVETIEGIRLIKQQIPARQDRARDLEHLVRPAGRRPRSRQLRLPLLLHESRTRSRHRQRREARALRLDSRSTSARWPKICCSTRPR